MTENTSTAPDLERVFGARFTFPVYLDAAALESLLENLRLTAREEGADLLSEEAFQDVFSVSENGLATPFEKETFGPQCVEVYLPDAPPEFKYPPAVVDNRPGIALVITTTMPARDFVVDGERVPATPEETRESFINAPDLEDLGGLFGLADSLGIGPAGFGDPNMQVQYAINNRLFQPDEVKAMFDELESLAKKTGALDLLKSSPNPYSVYYKRSDGKPDPEREEVGF